MSNLGAYVRRMIESGMDAVEAATVAAEIFQAGVSAAPYRDPAPVREETAHDRKKAYDRQYRQNERATSYDSRTTSYDSYDAEDQKGSTPPKNPPKEKPPKGGKKKGSRIPDDWRPQGEDWAFARDELGWPPVTIHAVAAKFLDYWRGIPGTKALKLDWSATWRNWCRTEAQRIPRVVGGTQPGQSRWAI